MDQTFEALHRKNHALDFDFEHQVVHCLPCRPKEIMRGPSWTQAACRLSVPSRSVLIQFHTLEEDIYALKHRTAKVVLRSDTTVLRVLGFQDLNESLIVIASSLP